ELPVICQGKSIRELRIRKITGANIIGFKKPDGAFVINPSPETRLTPQSSFIVFGNSEQLKDLRYYLENLTEKDLE
ncbi:MAG: TrkA C-terminal domain-containing protein, partial [Saprospiraceae bacterium]|nr:TrkA C-terminal domain-containing protein [Saprospiraceae bacterium]